MNIGESRTVNIQAENAYGKHYKEMVGVVGRGQFPPDMDVKVGQQFETQNEEGRTIIVTVTNVSASDVTLDANHPLAGKDLTFDVQLVAMCNNPAVAAMPHLRRPKVKYRNFKVTTKTLRHKFFLGALVPS